MDEIIVEDIPSPCPANGEPHSRENTTPLGRSRFQCPRCRTTLNFVAPRIPRQMSKPRNAARQITGGTDLDPNVIGQVADSSQNRRQLGMREDIVKSVADLITDDPDIFAS